MEERRLGRRPADLEGGSGAYPAASCRMRQLILSEGIANPGAICLSEDAYRQVKARLDLAVSGLGALQLKNVTELMRVYSLQVGIPAQAISAPPAVSGASPKLSNARVALPDKPSIAVLPFQNMSGDAEQEYFVVGMVEDIITGPSRIK